MTQTKVDAFRRTILLVFGLWTSSRIRFLLTASLPKEDYPDCPRTPGWWSSTSDYGILVTSMEQDPFHIYGQNGQAVAVILGQAAEMTLSQIAAMAKASDTTAGYLARNKSWRKAGRAAQGAAKNRSHTRSLEAAKNDAMDAVVKAIQRIVVADGKSDADIAARWGDFLAAVANANPRVRTRAFRKFQKTLIHSIGLKASKAVPLASGAASSAAQVAVVWDLANERGEFSLADRDLLMAPWLAVFPLPPDLTA